MVDFKKHINKAASKATIDPLELYGTLDRASDKGPLRDSQSAVLGEWHAVRRNHRDVIVKLHTGQGKTVGHAAGFNEPVEIIRNANLKRLSGNVENFFLSSSSTILRAYLRRK